MKHIAIIAVVAALFFGVASEATAYKHADGPSSVQMNMYLTVQFPTYPDLPSFTASAHHAELTYWLEKRGMAIIRGEDFPRLVYSSDDAPAGLKTITAVVEGMRGTQSTLDWTGYPTVRMYPVDLRVKIYDKVASALSRGDEPIVDIILSDLTLSTEKTCAEGLCTSGYLDAERLEAQLVFSAELPEANHAAYNEWLAGRPILGELRVQLPNPFKKDSID